MRRPLPLTYPAAVEARSGRSTQPQVAFHRAVQRDPYDVSGANDMILWALRLLVDELPGVDTNAVPSGKLRRQAARIAPGATQIRPTSPSRCEFYDRCSPN